MTFHKQKKQQSRGDKWLGLAVVLLVAVGLIMLYSVSTVESLERFDNTTYFLRRQMWQGVGIGLVALYGCYKIPYPWWQKLAPALVGASLFLLLLVKVPGIGFSSGGASRWIHAGPVFVQPAEFAKLVLVVYTAAWITSRKSQAVAFFSHGVLPLLAVTGLFAALILWQPDFGTMIVLLGTALAMLIASGMPWKWIFGLMLVGSTALYALVRQEPYRTARLLTFLNPSLDPQGAGYQINQSLIAVGSGGLWGLGYGLSRQKHNFLPEVLGDSVFAIIAEELGFVRVLAIFVLFTLLCARGFIIARQAPDTFSRLLAVGLLAMIILQVVINIGATVGMLPLTGIPLPFFSYGSSALIVNLAAVGILMQISKHSRIGA